MKNSLRPAGLRFWQVRIGGKSFEALWLGLGLTIVLAAGLLLAGVALSVAAIVAPVLGVASGIKGYAVFVNRTAVVLPPNPTAEDLQGTPVPLTRRGRRGDG